MRARPSFGTEPHGPTSLKTTITQHPQIAKRGVELNRTIDIRDGYCDVGPSLRHWEPLFNPQQEQMNQEQEQFLACLLLLSCSCLLLLLLAWLRLRRLRLLEYKAFEVHSRIYQLA